MWSIGCIFGKDNILFNCDAILYLYVKQRVFQSYFHLIVAKLVTKQTLFKGDSNLQLLESIFR